MLRLALKPWPASCERQNNRTMDSHGVFPEFYFACPSHQILQRCNGRRSCRRCNIFDGSSFDRLTGQFRQLFHTVEVAQEKASGFAEKIAMTPTTVSPTHTGTTMIDRAPSCRQTSMSTRESDSVSLHH